MGLERIVDLTIHLPDLLLIFCLHDNDSAINKYQLNAYSAESKAMSDSERVTQEKFLFPSFPVMKDYIQGLHSNLSTPVFSPSHEHSFLANRLFHLMPRQKCQLHTFPAFPAWRPWACGPATITGDSREISWDWDEKWGKWGRRVLFFTLVKRILRKVASFWTLF